MGAPMAHNLAKAGHIVLGFDTQTLTVDMVEIVHTPRDCAENVEVVITMLPNVNLTQVCPNFYFNIMSIRCLTAAC